MKKSFKIGKENFIINGKEEKIISGAMHYFRTVPEYWEDRLLKLRALGCNCVETYMPWNLHEPTKGKYDFKGMLNVEKFILTAEKLGLYVIMRPGPFICAEWEFGGLPAWLLKDRNIRLRSSDPSYYKHAEEYLKKIFDILKPLQIHENGPIIMIQVENEYGAYANDRKYLNDLVKLNRKYFKVPLFTADQPDEHMMRAAQLPGVFTTGNFGSRAKERFPKLRTFQPEGPLMCMEFWVGWFDYWGGPHVTRSADSTAKSLDEMLEIDGSVNIYMFHGGTNFGFMNGANRKYQQRFEPTVTSYDYSALLAEDGSITDKYLQCRNVISKYIDLDPLPEFKESPKIELELEITDSADLFKNIKKFGKPVKSQFTLTMEDVDQDYGYILYRTKVHGPLKQALVWPQDIRDRAIIYLDGVKQGVIYRDHGPDSIKIDIPEEAQLDILVENMGRVNYGPYSTDRKGITTGVQINDQYHHDWEIYKLPFKKVPKLDYKQLEYKGNPSVFRKEFNLEETGDTFLKLENWGKGHVMINGFNVGRYWEKGPQKTLYVPAPILKKSKNEIVIFELEKFGSKAVFQKEPDLGSENPVKKGIINWILSRM